MVRKERIRRVRKENRQQEKAVLKQPEALPAAPVPVPAVAAPKKQ